jgi:hypothetical protein
MIKRFNKNKVYYAIINSNDLEDIFDNKLSVHIFFNYVKMQGSVYLFKRAKAPLSKIKDIGVINNFHKNSLIYKNIKEFTGFKDFMKDYTKAKKRLLIKEIIE